MPKAKAEKSALPAKEAKKPKGGSGEKGQGRRATGSNTGLVSFFPYLIDEAARALHKYSNLAVYVDNEIGGGTEVLVDKLRQALRQRGILVITPPFDLPLLADRRAIWAVYEIPLDFLAPIPFHTLCWEDLIRLVWRSEVQAMGFKSLKLGAPPSGFPVDSYHISLMTAANPLLGHKIDEYLARWPAPGTPTTIPAALPLSGFQAALVRPRRYFTRSQGLDGADVPFSHVDVPPVIFAGMGSNQPDIEMKSGSSSSYNGEDVEMDSQSSESTVRPALAAARAGKKREAVKEASGEAVAGSSKIGDKVKEDCGACLGTGKVEVLTFSEASHVAPEAEEEAGNEEAHDPSKSSDKSSDSFGSDQGSDADDEHDDNEEYDEEAEDGETGEAEEADDHAKG